MTDLDKLKNMYANTSKHSNYQVLASELYHYLAKGDIDVRSRNEHIRLEFFLKNVNLKCYKKYKKIRANKIDDIIILNNIINLNITKSLI